MIRGKGIRRSLRAIKEIYTERYFNEESNFNEELLDQGSGIDVETEIRRHDKSVVNIYGASDEANRFRSDSNTLKKDSERHRSTGHKHILIFIINFVNVRFPCGQWL